MKGLGFESALMSTMYWRTEVISCLGLLNRGTVRPRYKKFTLRPAISERELGRFSFRLSAQTVNSAGCSRS